MKLIITISFFVILGCNRHIPAKPIYLIIRGGVLIGTEDTCSIQSAKIDWTNYRPDDNESHKIDYLPSGNEPDTLLRYYADSAFRLRFLF